MGLGLAFTDVLTDALMVENGRGCGLTGAFQSVQWAAIYTASILVGRGRRLPRRAPRLRGRLRAGRLLPARLVPDGPPRACGSRPRARPSRRFGETWQRGPRRRSGARDLWVVAGFIFFCTFSPSFGPALPLLPDRRARLQPAVHRRALARWAPPPARGRLAYAPLSRRLLAAGA